MKVRMLIPGGGSGELLGASGKVLYRIRRPDGTVGRYYATEFEVLYEAQATPDVSGDPPQAQSGHEGPLGRTS